MSEEVTEPVYIPDSSDQDHQRLLRAGELAAERIRREFRTLGVQPGWNAIDCGCGPLGSLAVLGEMVGPAGHVVGVDANPAAVDRARAAVSALELANVEVIAGDLHKLDSAALGGPFDLAFTRMFLMHQADPVRTLRHIAGLLRPGGWLVAHEFLSSPAPRAHPHLDALTDGFNVIIEAVHRGGVPAGVVENLPRSAREAGLEVAALSGSFAVGGAEAFELTVASLIAIKERATQLGIAADRIDDLARQIQAAKDTHEWVTSPFFLYLTLRKPVTA